MFLLQNKRYYGIFIFYKEKSQVNNNGYTLYPNGNQVYKRIGDYDVLITDYTGKKLSLDLLIIFELWIKNNITDVLIFRKMYKRTFFCPKMKKIDKEIAKIIEEV